jgi:hypothetical protein
MRFKKAGRDLIRNSTLASLAVACAIMANPSHAQEFSKEDVLKLHSLELGDEAIIAKIESEQTVFELTTDEMIQLREQGLSSAIIAAMVRTGENKKPAYSLDSPDPMVPHPAGVYVLLGSGADARMEKMNYTVTNQAKTGGIFGYALTGGLASASVKVAIQNESAPVQASRNPKFYFFFDNDAEAAQSSAWASGANTFVSSPSEFTLIRLKEKKGRREARVGSMNIAGAKTGVMDKDRIAFSANEVRPGVFEVAPLEPLEPGEYGFIFSLGASGTGGALTARIFDFSVR